MGTEDLAGFNADALARLRGLLDGLVQRGAIPGAVFLIERHGVRVCLEALGSQDVGRGLPMREDSIFRIFSMTKPIVSVAALMLVERGRLQLRDRVDEHLPAFAATMLGVDRQGECVHAAPQRAMTVHDLLRHTAGLTYEFHEPTPVRRLYQQAALDSRDRSNAQQVARLAALPLQHEPGSVWDYSRATDVLGGLIEAVAGMSLSSFLRTWLLEPLGMVDTGFALAPAQGTRLAEPLPPREPAAGARVLFDPRMPAALESGGGGLVSTALDYARFLRMLLQGGQLDGVRVLGRKSVEFMTSDHLGALPRSGAVLPAGHGFGLGVAVKTAVGQDSEPGSVGSYGWSGAAGTSFFVDPQESMFALVLTQAPDQFDRVREHFRTLVYAALDA